MQQRIAMSGGGSKRRVSHPILRLDVLGPDGRRQSILRVYCREKQTAVAVGTCCACVECIEITTTPAPAVVCRVSESAAAPPPDPLGLVTPVGQIVRSGPAVETQTTLGEAMAHLRSHGRLSVPVVDREQVVVGVLHDQPRRQPPGVAVGDVMRSRLSLPARTPIRRALELMAASHVREITVVDEEERPLGVFRDVDGLHWLAHPREH